VGTVMKRVYINALREYFRDHDLDHTDPHRVIGLGGELDMLVKARLAVTDEIVRFMEILGCCGKA